MVKTRNAIILVVAVVATAGILSTTAFTSATLDRSVDVSVVSDDAGPLALTAGSSDFVHQDSNGELTISKSGDLKGVNPDATYTIGSTSDPSSTYAFKITNTDDSGHDVTLKTTETTGNFSFTVYTGDGSGTYTSQGSTDDPSNPTATLATSGTAYVVMDLDSDGLSGASGSSDSISGDLKVSASAATTAN